MDSAYKSRINLYRKSLKKIKTVRRYVLIAAAILFIGLSVAQAFLHFEWQSGVLIFILCVSVFTVVMNNGIAEKREEILKLIAMEAQNLYWRAHDIGFDNKCTDTGRDLKIEAINLQGFLNHPFEKPKN